LIRGDASIGFNWGGGSPSEDCGIPVDNFSVRWIRDYNFFRSGTWYFVVTSNKRVRLYIDGNMAFDRQWVGVETIPYQTFISAGVHNIKLEFLESTGPAQVSLLVTPIYSCPGQCNPQFPNSGNCLNADFCFYPGRGCRAGYTLTASNCCCPTQ
jgi:hypothetical protein